MPRYLPASLVVVLAASSAWAGDVIDLIPDDAHGCVVISSAQQLDSRLQALGQRMKLPIPSVMSMIAARPEGTAGIDTAGSVAVAVLPTESGTSAVLYIPVKDYDAFVGQVENPIVADGITEGRLRNLQVIIAHKASHAVVTWTNRRPLLRRVLEYRADEGADALKRPQAEYDIYALLTSSGVKTLTELGQQGLSEATRVMKERVGEDNPALAGLQVYDTLFSLARDEVSSVTVSLRMDQDSAVRITKNVWFTPSGKMAPVLRDVPVPDDDLLAGLPNVPYVMAVGGVIPPGGMQPMIDFSTSMMKSMQQLYGLKPDQVDAMMALAMKYFSDMRGMSFLLGVGQGDAPLYNEMLAVMYVPDANKYLDDYLKYWDELSELLAGAEASFMKDASLEEMTLDGSRVLKLKMPIPNFQNIDAGNQGEVDALMNKLYGPDGMTAFMAVGDDRSVLVAYTSTDMLGQSLQANDKSKRLSEDDRVATTTRLLPDSPLITGFWSPSGTVAFANRLLRMMPATGGFQIPAFPETPPIGWTMHAKPLNLEFQAVVPLETLDAVGEMVGSLMNKGKTEAN